MGFKSLLLHLWNGKYGQSPILAHLSSHALGDDSQDIPVPTRFLHMAAGLIPSGGARKKTLRISDAGADFRIRFPFQMHLLQAHCHGRSCTSHSCTSARCKSKMCSVDCMPNKLGHKLANCPMPSSTTQIYRVWKVFCMQQSMPLGCQPESSGATRLALTAYVHMKSEGDEICPVNLAQSFAHAAVNPAPKVTSWKHLWCPFPGLQQFTSYFI